jgi:DNA-binding response OmpR family regulator
MAIKGNILIIEDDPETRSLLEKLFITGGYQVLTASDGPNGINTACAFPPDLIILDVILPGLDGYDTCVQLKEKLNVPILILTAKSAPADLTRGFQAGADDFVKKPFNPKELLLRTKILVHRYRLNNLQ